jgi:hypothetical protein
MFESIPQLQVFELRQKHTKSTAHVDFLKGLRYCEQLQELVLFSVYVSQDTMDDLLCDDYAFKHTLRHMILSDSGPIIEQENQIQAILSRLSVLHTLCLGQLVNPIHPWNEPVHDKHNVIIHKRQNNWFIQ